MVNFEVGKWYTCESWEKDNFAKFTKIIHEDKFCFEECIRYRDHLYKKDWWRAYDNMREVLLSEIKEYLPAGHPDLLINQIYELW